MRTLFLIALSFLPTLAIADEPLLRPGDRVAILGGTFVERMKDCGAIEAELQCRRPDWQLSLRNLGWSGDDVHGIARKRFDGPADGYARLLADVDMVDSTVVVVAYGFSEASDGDVDRFASGLTKLIDDLTTDTRRVILMTPIAMPGYVTSDYTGAVTRCREIVVSLGQQKKLPVINLDWRPIGQDVTSGGIVPSCTGYAKLATPIADALVGGSSCEGMSGTLIEAVRAKNDLFFHRFRPQNETYLLLFRKHEQGQNAAEIPKFDPLVDAADETIWAATK